MDKMTWAIWALEYLQRARTEIHDDFNDVMNELRSYQELHNEIWYQTCKNIIPFLYSYSIEFSSDTKIPSSDYPSPDSVESKIKEYRLLALNMRKDLEKESLKYQKRYKVDGPPFLVTVALQKVNYLLSAVRYVESKVPGTATSSPELDDVALVVKLSRRFHESVLSLAIHPHGGPVLTIANEWDCQYLFRTILAGIFADIRDEEWNPSVAGSSARCEFFLKKVRLMVELKYVRKSTDAAKIKAEVAKDLIDYGGNSLVDRVIFLVYDPKRMLKNPVALSTDLSGSTKGLEMVEVIVSPPRDC